MTGIPLIAAIVQRESAKQVWSHVRAIPFKAGTSLQIPTNLRKWRSFYAEQPKGEDLL